MSGGRSEIDLDRISRNVMRIDRYEYGYQEAMKWRQRIRDGIATLADCNKENILQHFDALAASAQAILSKGGGGLESMLEGLRRWRPNPTPFTESNPR